MEGDEGYIGQIFGELSSLTCGKVVAVRSDDKVCAEAVLVSAVLWIVNVILKEHFFHPKEIVQSSINIDWKNEARV